MSSRVTIVLIEHSYLLRAGLEQLFYEIPGLVLTEVFEGSEKALAEKVQKSSPDVVIIDPASLKTQLVSFCNQLNKNKGCFTIGLLTPTSPDNIRSHFSAHLNIKLGKYELIEQFKSILGKKITKKPAGKNDSILSEREQTIVKQVVNGLTNQEIADKLFLSIHTITTHRKNISNKLGIKTVSGLTVYALMNKIVEIHEIDHR